MRLLHECSSNALLKRKEFSEWVLGIGDGSIREANDEDIKMQIPDDLLIQAQMIILHLLLIVSIHLC